MMTNAMLTLKKFALICLYIINYHCSINAAFIKRENYELNKNYELVLPYYQKVNEKTFREYPLLEYKIKKCLSHYHKNLKKPKKYIEDSKEIERLPKKDHYIIGLFANSPGEESLPVINKTPKHDSNINSQFLNASKGKQIVNKSEEMEINELTSESSFENLFNAIFVGEPTTTELIEDQEVFDGIIVGESEDENDQTIFQPVRKYSETVNSNRRMAQSNSDTQPEEITENVTVFTDGNNENEMVANTVEKLLLEINLHDFMKTLTNYKKTHNEEITFNKLSEILSNRKGNGTTNLPSISEELRGKLSELGNTRFPYVYFDVHTD